VSALLNRAIIYIDLGDGATRLNRLFNGLSLAVLHFRDTPNGFGSTPFGGLDSRAIRADRARFNRLLSAKTIQPLSRMKRTTAVKDCVQP